MRISKRRQQYLDKFKFPYHGQIFSSIKACCEYYDVAYSCVFPLKKEKNITAEKALSLIHIWLPEEMLPICRSIMNAK